MLVDTSHIRITEMADLPLETVACVTVQEIIGRYSREVKLSLDQNEQHSWVPTVRTMKIICTVLERGRL